MRSSSDIRNDFLEFFRSKGHRIVPSAPVIPYGDPTLLFTNAGMNQFKDVFLGTGKRGYTRVADTQKCIRVSGKHNDLEEVGRDTYHHTFFEMLGNWSFGDYYKREAIAWAWELLTGIWRLPGERLWATVFETDDEALALWREVTDIDPGHILKFGAKDNFWEMGETGPCGPCSEIHIDLTPDGALSADFVNAGDPRLIEIWNLVFIQNNRNENRELEPLPAKHIDTGMGFERICAALLCLENGFQKPPSNYDTDVFTPLLTEIAGLTGKPYIGERNQTAMRVIADHVRALTFAIADGAIPSNEGRGYVLRRILRRAARFGRNLGTHEPFIYRIVPVLVQTMGSVFPEIVEKQGHIERIIKSEEEGFNATLDRGLEIFGEVADRVKKSGAARIPGEDVFRLYDTFGFPVDLTSLLAREAGMSIDEKGFDAFMDEQRNRSRKIADKPALNAAVSLDIESDSPTEFVGYEQTESESHVLYVKDNILVLEKTPFYAESGGQVGDRGEILINGMSYHVTDTQKKGDLFLHILESPAQAVQGTEVSARIDPLRRTNIQRNHSATHIVHEALRKVLGTHVHQQGSLVAPDRLRFDFPHFSKITPQELRDIEQLVNEKIKERIDVHAESMPIGTARKIPNVKMFFGEKYGEQVRVVLIDENVSVEFCGGTHVANTRDIGLFKIVHETGIASGVRRIEAVTGEGVERFLNEQIEKTERITAEVENLLREREELQKQMLNYDPATVNHARHPDRLTIEIPRRVRGETSLEHIETAESLLREREELKITLSREIREIGKQLLAYKAKDSLRNIDDYLKQAISLDGFKFLTIQLETENVEHLKSLGDSIRSSLGSGVGIIGAVIDQKAVIVCVVTDDLIRNKKLEAGKIVGAVAKIVGGGGGGKPHLATAGGKHPEKLAEALSQAGEIIQSMLRK